MFLKQAAVSFAQSVRTSKIIPRISLIHLCSKPFGRRGLLVLRERRHSMFDSEPVGHVLVRSLEIVHCGKHGTHSGVA